MCCKCEISSFQLKKEKIFIFYYISHLMLTSVEFGGTLKCSFVLLSKWCHLVTKNGPCMEY